MKVNWGVDASTVDAFDINQQYKPYDGPVPPNGVYHWRVKVLKYAAATRDKNAQLRAGLELMPRKGRKEVPYRGYFVMNYMPIAGNTQFRYVPFLLAIGATAKDFVNRTIADEEGNIRKIGGYRHDGEFIIAAELKDTTDEKGNPKKEIGWMGPVEGEFEYVEVSEVDDDFEDDEEEYDDDFDDDDFEEDDEEEEYDDEDEDEDEDL